MDQARSKVGFWPFFAAVVVSVVVLAAIVWSHAHPFGIHWDEADYLDQVGIDVQRLWAGKLLTLGGRILIKSWGRPPAYRLLAIPFLAVFGFHVITARLVSLACYCLSCWFVYRATCRIGGRGAAGFAVLLFALSPTVIAASIIFGTDAPLYLATSAMLYYVFTSWSDKSERPKNWIGLGLAIGLGLLAKSSFLVIAFPLFAFWLVAGHYGWLGVPSIKPYRKAGLLAFLIAAPWWLLNIKQSIAYAQYARGFVRNSLGSPSLETWARWLNTVIQCLLGHGLSILIVLVLVTYFVRAVIRKDTVLDRLKKAALAGCGCSGLPIVLAQLSGTNHLLRHISPAMIPLAICMGILAEASGWTVSWPGIAASSILFCGQLSLLTSPVVFPNKHLVSLTFPNGAPAWQTMARFDQWDWTAARNISQSCGLEAPKISYLGDGLAFDMPQIEYSWIAQGQAPPEVTWLWRSEDGELDWQKVMDSADQNDIVITAPGFAGEPLIKENLDNEHNAEFAERLSRDPRFRAPIRLAMGRFEPIEVLVFLKSAMVCHPGSAIPAQR
jgi:4-amino-4-deoxy-L-arabinose transferase-like glycosyltransferase